MCNPHRSVATIGTGREERTRNWTTRKLTMTIAIMTKIAMIVTPIATKIMRTMITTKRMIDMTSIRCVAVALLVRHRGEDLVVSITIAATITSNSNVRSSEGKTVGMSITWVLKCVCGLLESFYAAPFP